jgi:hypothetical protein
MPSANAFEILSESVSHKHRAGHEISVCFLALRYSLPTPNLQRISSFAHAQSHASQAVVIMISAYLAFPTSSLPENIHVQKSHPVIGQYRPNSNFNSPDFDLSPNARKNRNPIKPNMKRPRTTNANYTTHTHTNSDNRTTAHTTQCMMLIVCVVSSHAHREIRGPIQAAAAPVGHRPDARVPVGHGTALPGHVRLPWAGVAAQQPPLALPPLLTLPTLSFYPK